MTTRSCSFSYQRKPRTSSFEPCRIPHWLAPVWELQSVCQARSSWLPARSQAARVGSDPSRTARRATSCPSPSICRNTTPGGSAPRSGAPRPRRRARRKKTSSSLTASTLLITPAVAAIATATTREVAKLVTSTPGMA